MKEFVFKVGRVSAGWMIDSHLPMGPYWAKDHAVDLAEGMAKALRETGHKASVVVVDGETSTLPSAKAIPFEKSSS